MTTPHRTLQMALDALDAITDDVDGTGLNTMPSFDKALDAIAALREALNAPEPEPVAWKCANCGNTSDCQGVGQGDNWCNSCAVCGEMKPLYAAPPAAPADDHATPSGGQEAGPQEDRIEAAYWRFDARHKGYSQWKTAPMSERDAFKAEMRNALEAEKVRAEMRLVARGWRRPDAPAAPAPAAPVPDGWVMVPREPTEDMIQAAAGAWGESEGGLHNAFAAALRGGIAASPAAPVVPMQGGMDNNELLAAWQKKLPGRVPEGQELNAFAVGTEVGFEHAQKLERMDWDRVHHVLAKHGKHPGRTDDHLADVIDAALSAAPVVPLTDEQLAKIAVEDEFLLYCDQDSFNEIARAIEAAHGITGASK